MLLRNVLKAIKDNPERTSDIIDSFSDNQYLAKNRLIEILDDHDLIHEDATIAIFGCWYGSILVSELAPRVKKIMAFDIDSDAIKIGKNTFFPEYENVRWYCQNVFDDFINEFEEVDVFINTSCEHMRPMIEWGHPEKYIDPWWDRCAIANLPAFAFQSNNMFDIEGHVNCVNSIEEFAEQLPKHKTLHSEVISDTRGSRFLIVGNIVPGDLVHNHYQPEDE